MELLIGIVVIGGFVALLWYGVARKSSKTATTSKELDSLLAQVERTYKEGGMIISHRLEGSNLALGRNEVALLPAAPAAFGEEKSHARYIGGSIRVAKGVRVSGGRADSIPTIKPIDEGRLILTNQRIVFLGAMRTHEVRWNQLDGFAYTTTALLIRKSRREKVMYFALPTARIVGRVIEIFLAHDDWTVQDAGAGFRSLVHGNAPNPFAEDDKTMAAALASIMSLVLNADGVTSEQEIQEARRIVGVWEAELEGVDSLGDVLEGRGMPPEQAIAYLRERCLASGFREDLLQFFQKVADADGRSPEEQAVLDEIREGLGLSASENP